MRQRGDGGAVPGRLIPVIREMSMRFVMFAVLLLVTACAAPQQQSSGSSADRRVRLVNNSSKTVISFYASNTRRDGRWARRGAKLGAWRRNSRGCQAFAWHDK